MKSLSIILAIFIASLHGLAQKVTLVGHIIDSKSKQLANATVVLHHSKDSSLVKTELSTNDGMYEFTNIDTGSYFIMASYVGKQQQFSSTIIINEKSLKIITTDIILLENSKSIKEVNITAKKPLIQVMADKTVFNVEQSLNTIGNNGLELLQKSPGVVIDKDDNVILKGRSSVRIFINGKPSVLEGKDLAGYLRGLNANDIEAIEIISNPGAKYEAEGGGGIINIKLKKNKKFGTNGVLNLGAQFYKYTGADASLSLNHRNKNYNVYGNYSGGFGKGEQQIALNRWQNLQNFNNISVQTDNNFSNTYKAGIDYTINSKHAIGAEVNGNYTDGNWSSIANTFISNDAIKIDSLLKADNINNSTNLSINSNINYRYADTASNTLGIDLDYGIYNATSKSDQPNYYKTGDGKNILRESIYQMDMPVNINVLSLKVDAEKLAFKGKVGFGGKVSKVKTENIFNFYDVNSYKVVLNNLKSNQFAFNENINALYANYARELTKKLSLTAGLRMENTNSKGLLTSKVTSNDSNVTRSYTDFFPSLGFSFNPHKDHSFTMNYSRRIDRPSYQDLNPFENKIDELTYQKGNAYLRPQYAQTIDVSHTYKYFLNTSLGFSHTIDKFMQTTDTTEINRTYVTNKNFGSEDIAYLSISAPLPIKKWLFMYVSLNSNYTMLKADFEGRKLTNNYFSYNGYAEANFTLPKGYTYSVSGFYTGPTVWGGTFRTRPFGAMDMGVSKLFFNKKMTIKVSLSDVFKTNIIDANSDFSGLRVHFNQSSLSRQFKINMTYRFGNNNVKAKEGNNKGADEVNRIKQGK